MSSTSARPIGQSNSDSASVSESPPFKRLKRDDSNFKEKETITVTERKSNCSDWRDDCIGVRDINYYALKKKLLTDVTFLVGDKREVFEAHRLFLALASPVFEAMFFGALAEKENTITIPDVEPEGFFHLLKFLYSERLCFMDYKAAFKTAFAADKYCISNLINRCERYLKECELTSDNVWEFLENSLYLNLKLIKIKSLIYIKNHTDCLEHASFLEVSEKTVEEVLIQENIVIEESKLLSAVLRWAEFRSNSEEPDSFKNLSMPLLKHIHFSLLSPSEFVRFLQVKRLKEVLDESSALLILQHMIQPTLCSLPDWCWSKSSRRSVKSNTALQEKKGFTVRCHLRFDKNVAKTTIPKRNRYFLPSSSSSSSFSSSSSSSSSCSSSSDISDILDDDDDNNA